MQNTGNTAFKSRIKILVVDDHPSTAQTLARALSQLGPHVEAASATSGKEALAMVKDSAADILITDMIMPGMTGVELIEKLHNHPAGRPTFSFLMTAYDVPGLQVTARRLNVKDVIIKPINPERICQIVSRAIEDMGHVMPLQKPTFSKTAFKILIADDQPDNLVLLGRYLVNEGYDFIEAHDGLETLEKVRSELPDLVLLDVNMPYKDGFAVLEEIRSDPAVQHIPVIIITAMRLDPVEIQSGLNMGADDYITKPFDRRELFARIRTKLRVKEAEDTIRRRNRELNLLPEIGKELSARINIEDLTTILLKRTVETLGALFGHIVIFNPAGMYQKTCYFDPAASTAQFTLPPKLLETIKTLQQGCILDDVHNDERWQSSPSDPTSSAMIVPLRGRKKCLGALMLANENTAYFNEDHLLLLQAIASQASIAIENAQLYDAMAQEQQRLAAVLQNAEDAILMFDVADCLTLVNPAGQKLFTDYEVKLGRPLTTDAGYDSFIHLLEKTRSANVSSYGEVTWPDKRVFSALITPTHKGEIVVVLHDVTHFKELERVKDEFIATASHDLRNPLTSIKGYSQLATQAGPLTDLQKDFMQRIKRATENMEGLVENMLNLAKMDLGMKLRPEELIVEKLLRELADEFQPQAEKKELALKLDKAVPDSKVKGDVLQIQQALRNLIGNAIKYTPKGGMVKLSLTQELDMVNIKIEDTGYGIPPADLPHIFDRFYRVRNTDHDDIEGNGLGLAIVKSIAEAHGGDVIVESEVGKGSCFTLSLPLYQIRESTQVEQ